MAISLAIVWTKLDDNRTIFLKLIQAQNKEIEISQAQFDHAKAQEQSQAAAISAIETDVFNANKEITDAIDKVKQVVLSTQADMIKRDVEAAEMRKRLTAQMGETLRQVTEITQDILKATQATTAAAQEASDSAQTAAESSQANGKKLDARPTIRTRVIYRVKKKPIAKNWFQKLFGL